MAILPEQHIVNNNSESFKPKAKIVGKTHDDDNTKDAKITILLE